jgi:hypothetical protein
MTNISQSEIKPENPLNIIDKVLSNPEPIVKPVEIEAPKDLLPVPQPVEIEEPPKPTREEIEDKAARSITRAVRRVVGRNRRRKIRKAEEIKIKKEQAMQKLMNISATKVQKNYKGFKARQGFKTMLESIVQDTSQANPHRVSDMLQRPIEEILAQKDEVLHPEVPIVEAIIKQASHVDKHAHAGTDVEVIKGALREVFLENMNTLTRLLKSNEP